MAGVLWSMLWSGMLGLGGWWASGRGFRQSDGLSRAIGAAVLAWAWATLGALVLGLSGHLARWPLLAWAAAGLALGGLVRAIAAPPPGSPDPPREPLDGAAMIGLSLTLWAVAVGGLTSWLLPVKAVTDGPIYHLHFAAQWWKSGRVSIIPAPFGDMAVSYLPADGELFFAALMALADGDTLARLGQVPFLILAAASAFAIARFVGAGTSAAILAVGLFVACPPMIAYSFDPNVDTIFVAGYLAASYFFLRYGRGDDRASTLALGALAAGGAWGSKATGTVFVPPLLAVAAVAVLARGGPWRRRFGHLLVLALAPWVLAGYWFARNTWLTGNPLYPLQVSALGRVWLPGWFESSAMKESPFYQPPGDLRLLADAVLNMLDPRLVPLWVAGLLAAWIPRRGGSEGRGAGVIAALAVANVGLYWLLIPYRSQHRFLLPAIGLATAPLAGLLDRSRWLRWAAAGLLAIHLLTPTLWPLAPFGRMSNWGLSGRLITSQGGYIRAIPSPAQWRAIRANPALAADLAMTLASGLLAVLTAREWAALRCTPSAGRRLRAAMATAALVALPYALMAGFLEGAEKPFPDAPLARAWYRLDGIAGLRRARIAYAGTNLVYYLMGRGQRHDVAYVNVDAHRDWRLHDYHREAAARGEPNWPDPRPAWDRLHPDYEAWLANLAAERIDFLFLARPDPSDGRFNIADADGYPIERVWADAHPEAFTLVSGPAQGDPAARIYRVHPPGRPRSRSS
jgi:hypothetical protein